MTPRAFAHVILSGLAIVGAVVLAATGHLDATAAVAVIVAGAGIGSTGVAGSSSAASLVTAQPATASTATAVRTPSTTA